MNVLLILGGFALLVTGWAVALVADGWNAPAGKVHLGPLVVSSVGAVSLIVGLVRAIF